MVNKTDLFNRTVPVDNNWIKQQIKESIADFKAESGQTQNILSLLFYQRAISNYVKILTGRDIPVRFANEAMLQRQGEKEEIIISAMQGPESFDISVGAALHEASRIILTDKDWLLPPFKSRGDYGDKLTKYLANTGYVDTLNSKAFNEINRFNSFLGSILNWIEDRRIDTFIFNSSPGYKNYYHQLYLKYYLSKIIDKAILANRIKDEDITSYLFYITNLLNSKVRGDELKGLRDIKSTLTPDVLKNLKSTEESAMLALQVIHTVDSFLKLEEDYQAELKRQEEERLRKEEEARQKAAADELKRQQQEELNKQNNPDEDDTNEQEDHSDNTSETQEDDEPTSEEGEETEDEEDNEEADEEGDERTEEGEDAESSESSASEPDMPDETDSGDDSREDDNGVSDDIDNREEGEDREDSSKGTGELSGDNDDDQEDAESSENDSEDARGDISSDNESGSTMEGNAVDNDGEESAQNDWEDGADGDTEHGSGESTVDSSSEDVPVPGDEPAAGEEPVVDWTEQDEKELGEALDKQLDFLTGEPIKKKAIGWQQAQSLNALAHANVDVIALDSKTNIVNIVATKDLITSGAIRDCIQYNPWDVQQADRYTKSSEVIAVTDGMAAGRRLSALMRLVNEDNTIIYNQQKKGRLDGRAVSGLGYGRENIYYRKEIVGYKKNKFHITVDGSGSMDGDKWCQTLQFISTLAQAFKLVGTIDLMVSIRYSAVSRDMKQGGKDNFINLIIYDSTKHTIGYLRQTLPCYCTTGNTPEGACYVGLLGSKYLPKQLDTQHNHYFITLTDGGPTYYRRERGRRWSKENINNTGNDVIHQQAYYRIKTTGYKTLAYFLYTGTVYSESTKAAFDEIYGSDGRMLSVTELSNLARALNEMLLNDKINK